MPATTTMFLALMSAAAAVATGPPPVPYPNYGEGPSTFYLHKGSSYQQGCWGPTCFCPISERAAMHGTMTVTLANVGDATDFYTISDVSWRVPTVFGQAIDLHISGGGDFAAGQHPFNQSQVMSLDLALNPPQPPGNVQEFTSEFAERTAAPPVIDIELSNNWSGCPSGIRVRVVATWFRSDWNADAQVTVGDLFDFLADYFGDGADYNHSGRTTVGDVFAFLSDWFAAR